MGLQAKGNRNHGQSGGESVIIEMALAHFISGFGLCWTILSVIFSTAMLLIKVIIEKKRKGQSLEMHPSACNESGITSPAFNSAYASLTSDGTLQSHCTWNGTNGSAEMLSP